MARLPRMNQSSVMTPQKQTLQRNPMRCSLRRHVPQLLLDTPLRTSTITRDRTSIPAIIAPQPNATGLLATMPSPIMTSEPTPKKHLAACSVGRASATSDKEDRFGKRLFTTC
jgi:hypothetical protein